LDKPINSSTPTGSPSKVLRYLEEHAVKRIGRSLLLYTGSGGVAFGLNLHAGPVSALWQLQT